MYCTIKCTCGHEADIDEFMRSRTGITLKRGHYQCPLCNRAWTVQAEGHAKVYPSGLVIPAPRIMKKIQAVL